MRLDPRDRERCQECGQPVTEDPNIRVVYHAQTGSRECPPASEATATDPPPILVPQWARERWCGDDADALAEFDALVADGTVKVYGELANPLALPVPTPNRAERRARNRRQRRAR